MPCHPRDLSPRGPFLEDSGSVCWVGGRWPGGSRPTLHAAHLASRHLPGDLPPAASPHPGHQQHLTDSHLTKMKASSSLPWVSVSRRCLVTAGHRAEEMTVPSAANVSNPSRHLPQSSGVRPQPRPCLCPQGAELVNAVSQRHLTSVIPTEAWGSQSFRNVDSDMHLVDLMRSLLLGLAPGDI